MHWNMAKLNMNIIGLIIIMLFSDYSFSPVNIAQESFSGNTSLNANNVQEGLNIGNKAPELESVSPNGEILKLSSLHGKVVLIDFRASWYLPCRNESPNLVKAYKQYKDASFKNGSGFSIYSISIDKDKEQWISAIKDDNLLWKTHVSDHKVQIHNLLKNMK